MARPPQTYKVIRLYKASPTKKLNIVGSLDGSNSTCSLIDIY